MKKIGITLIVLGIIIIFGLPIVYIVIYQIMILAHTLILKSGKSLSNMVNINSFIGVVVGFAGLFFLIREKINTARKKEPVQ